MTTNQQHSTDVPSRREPATGEQVPSQRVLRALVRRSPLLRPIERAHWLRLLPHLTAQQRRELADLLAPAPDSDASAR
ncbi:MAG: hypothetical protein IRZ14_19605 [Chloroflexi bacterium]|nr:hypothetical protein [Chloroflexota bacterium]